MERGTRSPSLPLSPRPSSPSSLPMDSLLFRMCSHSKNVWRQEKQCGNSSKTPIQVRNSPLFLLSFSTMGVINTVYNEWIAKALIGMMRRRGRH